MSTGPDNRRALAAEALQFVRAFDIWSRRASVAKAGESVPRLRLLYELHCNGPRKMADLADTLGVTPRAVTTIVDALEGEALVRRSAHPSDRRITMIELTSGAGGVEGQFAAFQAEVADLFAGLDDSDAETLRRTFRVLRARIEEPGRAGTRGQAEASAGRSAQACRRRPSS
jgi:DNA-binding MarR family transcriptional regulator